MDGYDMLAPEQTDTAPASAPPDAQLPLKASNVTELHEARVMATNAVDALGAATNPAVATNVSAATIATTITTTNTTITTTATPSRAEVAGVELFGSFFLGDDEFALPAHCIHEVVNFPEKITAIPLSPHFLEGVFTLRGDVIPIINIGKIFDPAAASADASQKIAILDHSGVRVGLLFHSTGEILRVSAELRHHLVYRDTASHSVVAGTIRLDNGARLLQILDPSALISIENVPQIMALKQKGRTAQSNQFQSQAERRQCVSFKIGGIAFAFEMNAIREIINVPELKNSVLQCDLCLGRINLRGNAVAVVDFGKLLNLKSSANDASSERRIVIARIGDVSIGLMVDSVDNIFSFFPGDILPVPLLGKNRTGMFGGCIVKEGIGEIVFLNHQEIFSTKEIADITRGHTDLYQAEAAGDDGQSHAASVNTQRQVYITFGLQSTYAIEIRQIREIIDFSDTLIESPGMPVFIRGILNLRRQMITVIDLRCLYGMPLLADMSAAKILVIEQGEDRYGLVVDNVENIITVADSDRMPTPRIMRNQVAKDLHNDLQEVIEVADGGRRERPSAFLKLPLFSICC